MEMGGRGSGIPSASQPAWAIPQGAGPGAAPTSPSPELSASHPTLPLEQKDHYEGTRSPHWASVSPFVLRASLAGFLKALSALT